MKQRVISGVYVAIVTVLAAYFGGFILKAVLTFVALYGSYEFIKIRKEKFNYLLYIIMAVSVLLMM